MILIRDRSDWTEQRTRLEFSGQAQARVVSNQIVACPQCPHELSLMGPRSPTTRPYGHEAKKKTSVATGSRSSTVIVFIKKIKKRGPYGPT